MCSCWCHSFSCRSQYPKEEVNIVVDLAHVAGYNQQAVRKWSMLQLLTSTFRAAGENGNQSKSQPQHQAHMHASKHLTSEPTVEEIATFHKSLSQSGTKSAVLSLLPQYCDKYTPRAEKGTLPKPLTDLYSKKYFDITTFSELLGECEGICTQVTYISEQHCKMVEEVTRNQGGSKMWHVYRAGRVTASNFKSAVHTSPDKPSTSLILKICYPESNRFTTKATQWGIENEQLAIASFLKMAR